MATFKFGRTVDIHWNGYDIVGPADTVFSIPDQLYEEFDGDIAPVEPTLQWIDTNEFLTLSNSVSASTLSATFPISATTTTSGKLISIVSTSASDGYVLTANGSGGVAWEPLPADATGITSIIGTSPISAAVSGSQATISIDQTLITAGAATTAEGLRTYVKNTSGSAMTKGQAVYVSGADGTNVTIQLATASTEAGSSKTLGILYQGLANNEFGWVVESGYLGGIDTSAATAGDSVWLGNTPGSLVFGAPPAEPSNSVYIGVVARSNINNGEILVKVQNGYELDELHDVFVGGVSTALPLVYNSTSSGWVAQALTSVGIADNAVVAAKIDAGAVTSAKIADDAVFTSKIIDSAVTSSKLADGSVVAAKISAGAVGSAAISAGAVGSAAIASGSVNTSAINSGAAASGTVLTANGTGGATFQSAAAAGFNPFLTVGM